MNEFSVAVIVAAYRAEAYVRTCVDAVLAQSHANLRLYLVDDASPDGTADVVARHSDPRVKVLRQPANRGPAAARNAALAALADERFIWTTDADCVPRPDCLRKLLAALLDDQRVGVAGGANPQDWARVPYAAAVFDISNRNIVDPRGRPGRVPYVIGANMLLRREVVDAVGPYDEDLRIGEDFDLCLRARAQGWEVAFVPDAISEHRHPRTGVRDYLGYQYTIGYFGCRLRLKHRSTAPFARFYPGSASAAWLMAPAYVSMAVFQICRRNLRLGHGGRLVKSLPLVVLGQLWNTVGMVRGVSAQARTRRAAAAG